MVLSRALNLAESDLEGLILLAGLDPRQLDTRTLNCIQCNGETETTLTEQVRKTIGPSNSVSAAIRTRTCVDCGHSANSTERWTEEPEEIAHMRLERILKRIEKANIDIRRALEEAV